MKKLKYLVLIPTLLPVALAQAADSGPNPDAVGADETSILYWSAKASAPDCSADFVESLRTPLDAFERHPDGTFVNREFKSVRCNLTLRPDDEIFYRLIVKGSAASGVTIDCNGALINGWVGPNYNTEDRRSTEMIEINSIARQPEPSWDGEYDVPQYVTVKNCRIRGSIRIRGMGSNGEAAEVVRSSRRPGHLDRLRDNAPSHVVIENVDFTPKKRTPLYLTPGVHHVTVRDSTFSGNLNRSTMYMDVSSSHNLVVRNTFRARNQDTDYLVYRRTFPEIAVDGSHHNHIKNNLFTEHVKEEGGIWLYRNCGEGGGIRWTGPEYNVIEGNDFYDLSSDFLNDDEPAIHIGSRDNGLTGFKPYCNDDEGVSGVNYAALSGMNPPHSAEDNGNYARYNRVLHNTFYGISSGDRVKIRDNGKNTENIRVNNQGIQSYRNTLFAYPREGDTFGEARVDKFANATFRRVAGRWYPAFNADYTDMKVGDFDGNGLADVFTVSDRKVYLQKEDPELAPIGVVPGERYFQPAGFGAHQILELVPRGPYEDPNAVMLVGDANGDGRDDIVMITANDAGRAVYRTYLSTPSGFHYHAMSILAGFRPDFRWSLADVTGDGKADLVNVYLNGTTPRIWVHKSYNGAFGYKSSFTVLTRARMQAQDEVLFADVDGDGRKDMVHILEQSSRARANVYRSVGTGFTSTYSSARLFANFSTRQFWRSCDFDGDGRDDLVNVYPAYDNVRSWLHLSDGSNFDYQSDFTTLATDYTTNMQVHTADFDGDGECDIARFDETLWGLPSETAR